MKTCMCRQCFSASLLLFTFPLFLCSFRRISVQSPLRRASWVFWTRGASMRAERWRRTSGNLHLAHLFTWNLKKLRTNSPFDLWLDEPVSDEEYLFLWLACVQMFRLHLVWRFVPFAYLITWKHCGLQLWPRTCRSRDCGHFVLLLWVLQG